MKKRKGLTKAPVSRQKDHNAIAAKSKAAQPHTINITPLVELSNSAASLARKRVGALIALILVPYTFHQWNTYPVRVHDLTAPYILASCEESRYADGLYRRWGSINPETTCPAAVTQTLVWSSFTNALASKCELEPRLTRLDRFLRDMNSTRHPAQPQQEEPERIQTQVASYQEGMTP